MDLHAYLSSPGAPTTVAFAAKLRINPDQIRQWRHGYGKRRPGPEACVDMERESGGQITCEALRPDLPWSRQPDRSWPNKKGRPVLDFAKAAA